MDLHCVSVSHWMMLWGATTAAFLVVIAFAGFMMFRVRELEGSRQPQPKSSQPQDHPTTNESHQQPGLD